MFTMKPEGGSNSRDAASWSLCEVYLTAGGRKSCWVSDEFQKQDEGVGGTLWSVHRPPCRELCLPQNLQSGLLSDAGTFCCRGGRITNETIFKTAWLTSTIPSTVLFLSALFSSAFTKKGTLIPFKAWGGGSGRHLDMRHIYFPLLKVPVHFWIRNLRKQHASTL